MDITQIENDLRRIMNSRKSIVERTKMADTLCQKVNEYHALLQERSSAREAAAASFPGRRCICMIPIQQTD
jgi:hypothetical protein